MEGKEYIVIVQCHIVKEQCSGYFCEKAFTERTGGFADYPADKNYRTLYMTCGGCCGRALHRKLSNLTRKIKAQEKIKKEQIIVQLSSCTTRESYHGLPCPHLDYIKALISKVGLEFREDTRITPQVEAKRATGEYQS